MKDWSSLELLGLEILGRLEEAGYEAYFVGGYVRDKVWGKPVKDIDIATSALPERVVQLFERTIPTGLKHGTVTVLRDGIPYEVTTFRKESEYADFRRPMEVEFISDLYEDLRRRDFTMNAMAMDRSGHIQDPFQGQLDMEQRRLRCVGDPLERFQEDALRMLRCIRFASTYSLVVDPVTWAALEDRRELLTHVAMERVRVELERIMEGPAPYGGWRMLLDSGLLKFTKVSLGWAYSRMAAEDLPDVLSALDQLADPINRWQLLFIGAETTEQETKELCKQLTFSTKELERMAKAIAVEWWMKNQEGLSDEFETNLEVEWKRAALQYGQQALEDWLNILEASNCYRIESKSRSLRALLLDSGRQWLIRMPVREMKELALTGKALMSRFNLPPGPWVGVIMAKLLEAAALGQVRNQPEELLELAVQLKPEGDSL